MTTGSLEKKLGEDKPKLLVLELWGLGDLAIATPFLKEANRVYQVTLLAKPHAVEMQRAFWPDIEVLSFTAPWTKFRGKYNFLTWNWRDLFKIAARLRNARFELAVSARWDPRDHFLLGLSRAKRRLGFPRSGSHILLTQSLRQPLRYTHHYDLWRILGKEIGIDLLPREQKSLEACKPIRSVLIHSGAAQPVRVWPLERMLQIAERLRSKGITVRVACDANQRTWWQQNNQAAECPTTVGQLMTLLEKSDLFIANDSGPGHVAAAAGIPTFTIFGPQLPEIFLPVHPQAGHVAGKPCPYKPCFDNCRFPVPHCILNVTEEEVWAQLSRHLKPPQSA